MYLKLETVHDTGAFKIRGATNHLLNLSEEERTGGVLAAATTANYPRSVGLI